MEESSISSESGTSSDSTMSAGSLNRCSKLGFKPQKENIYNTLLPYSDALDEESVFWFSEIKENLGRAVMMRELRPGSILWTSRLASYIKMFGMKFSKEDHLALIKLMYELVIIPGLEPASATNFSQVLISLLKKKELISPDELELPWKPLYDLYKRITCPSNASVGMFRYFSSFESILKVLIHSAKTYFPISATQEILDIVKPQICPLVEKSMLKVVLTMEWFLPVNLRPDHHHLGFQLWFDEIMNLWTTCHNVTIWESEMMWLIARLASNNIGYINWEPYIPLMFGRFLASLNLPVSYKHIPSPKQHKMDIGAIALWIISTLGGDSSTQKYLNKFMQTLESYFHPANSGHWNLALKELLRQLPLQFVLRLHRERFRKPSWETQVPPSHKLTDQDITDFVESLKPVAMQAMFYKFGFSEVTQAMRYLATLKPSVIIPEVLDRVYGNLETVTQPHKLTAAMRCLASVARPLISGSHVGYADGPTHVVPLLMAMLPGIDANDIHKCLVTFQCVSTFVSMIPIVDSSHASEHWNDLSAEEETVCSATADFEDFILQFLDRCFVLIESSSLEVTRMERDMMSKSKIENMAETAITSTISSVLMQTSPNIFKSALRKLHSFVTGHILETKVAGQATASVCCSFAKVNPEETLKCLLPHLINSVISLTESEEVLKEETLDNELLYNLLIISELVDCPGPALLPYKDEIIRVLDRTLHLVCKEAYKISCQLLANLMLSLSATSPAEYRCLAYSFDGSVKDHLTVRDWGKPGNIHKLNLSFYTPTESTTEMAQNLLDRYLLPELNKIELFIQDQDCSTMSREELHCSLSIIKSLLVCRPLLPLWDEEPLTLSPTRLSHKMKARNICDSFYLKMNNGGNVRKAITDVMNRLQVKLLKFREDDIQSLLHLIGVWERILMFSSCYKVSYDLRYKTFQSVKKLLEDKVVGQKRHLRHILIDRIMLQHEALMGRYNISITDTHSKILANLYTLATSHYSKVRTEAQNELFKVIDNVPYSYTLLLPRIVTSLKLDPVVFHEQFKGALYVALGPKKNPILTRYDWDLVCDLWPTLVKAKPSEKPSVLRLYDNIVDCVHKHFPTITINLEIPDDCIVAAKKLWNSPPYPVNSCSDETVTESLLFVEKQNKENAEKYLQIVNTLVDAAQTGNLHWRFQYMAVSFLRNLVHPDVKFPASAVNFFLSTLIHDSIELRKVALRIMLFVLKQQKREHKTVVIVPYKVLQDCDVPEIKVCPGERCDNKWLQYNSKTLPNSTEEWNKLRYYHQVNMGFYDWPKELTVYAPSTEQPSLDRVLADLNDQEREIEQFFCNEKNVEKLVGYFSLEERKGKDKFNAHRYILFKGLFRNHGDRFLNLFVKHLEKLVVEKQESSQRCAAEIIAGIIRGTKHWTYEKVSSFWKLIVPIIQLALANMTVESVTDWGVCFATAQECRDPNKQHWLLESLMDNPIRNEASYINCGRLFVLQGALVQQGWRVSELFCRLLEYLKPFLNHPFQNVRERLGSVMVNIFENDLVLPGGNQSSSPHTIDFLEEVYPKLEILLTICSKEGQSIKNTQNGFVESVSQLENMHITEDDKEVAIRLYKTVCRWIISSVQRNPCGELPVYYKIFSMACHLESYDPDEELCKLCSTLLAALSKSLTLVHHVPTVLKNVEEVSCSQSWQARATCLSFLQVFVFYNMPILLSDENLVSQVTDIVLRLLEDDWPDVRHKASQVLSGLLHCNFISKQEELLESFKDKSRLKVKRLQKVQSNSEALKRCHSGILGLCSYINAHPYDIPENLPSIFLVLGEHINDPQLVSATIRKTLEDFKRTHHDSWQQECTKFTDEQLAVLADLAIPPSYCV